MNPQQANVALVRSLFTKADDDEAAMTFDGYVQGGWDSYWAPDIVYCGTSVRGELQMALGKEAVFEMSREPRSDMEPDEQGEQLLECVAFGDEMVAAHVRCHRRLLSTGEAVSYEFVMLVRIENGIITRGVDIGERKIDDMYRKLRGYSTPSPVLAATVSSARHNGDNNKSKDMGDNEQ